MSSSTRSGSLSAGSLREHTQSVLVLNNNKTWSEYHVNPTAPTHGYEYLEDTVCGGVYIRHSLQRSKEYYFPEHPSPMDLLILENFPWIISMTQEKSYKLASCTALLNPRIV